MVMGELTTNVDVAVIGAGPGGYTAAIRAAHLGKEVVLIEKDRIGGTCTNIGCIPSKAIIHAANTRHLAEHSENMGIYATLKMDFKKTQEWKQGIVESLSKGIEKLCRLNEIQIINGNASFTSSDTIHVEGRTIRFKKAIIATGTKIRELGNLPYDHERIIDSTDALELKEIPKSMIIVGGGYIAVEMACAYLMLGSKVTIVYRGERLLREIDHEISKIVLEKIKQLGGEIFFNSAIEKTEDRFALLKTPDGKRKLEFERLLVAAGRTRNYDGLGLDKTKVQLEDNFIKVDETMRTTDENIFAVGDVVIGPALAHKAFREGKIAAEVIAGRKSAFDNLIPLVVFSDPPVASVGLTEEQAAKKGIKTKIGKMPFSASGKARTMNATDGFVKIIANQDNVILGVHVIGPEATELIAEATVAMEMGARLEDLALTIHAHPTLPEALAEAAEVALGQAINIYRK
ncbi:dihydrolipoyl dehydrogenase [Candidatus Micrarchaeota archaeon]|nr:dihydrolipoyl dehydrogenase [Candidatus Micrarchaeota archaeon]